MNPTQLGEPGLREPSLQTELTHGDPKVTRPIDAERPSLAIVTRRCLHLPTVYRRRPYVGIFRHRGPVGNPPVKKISLLSAAPVTASRSACNESGCRWRHGSEAWPRCSEVELEDVEQTLARSPRGKCGQGKRIGCGPMLSHHPGTVLTQSSRFLAVGTPGVPGTRRFNPMWAGRTQGLP